MKQMITAGLVVLLALFAWGDEVAVQEDQELAVAEANSGRLIPDIEVMGGKLSIHGFVNVEATSSEGVGSEATWGNFRVNSNWAKGKLLLHTQINFADMQGPDDEGNWLREATVGWKIDDKFTLSGGRLFVAGGMSTPGQYDLETIRYPNSLPFNCYAYGVQGTWDSEHWFIMGDVTGKSGLSFLDEENFEAFEVSAFIQRKFESGSALNFTTQISRDFQRYGLGGGVALSTEKTIRLRGEGYYVANRDEETSDMIGGYVLVTWQATKWLELFGQADHRQWLAKEWTETSVSVDPETLNISCETEAFKSSGEGLTTLSLGGSIKAGENVTFRGNVELPFDGSTSSPDPMINGLVQVEF
ncbi:MAG: hypothetical protein WC531_02590 [Candidatus Paceibacterota bacterium]|jgi:hypothetical protein